MSHYQNQREQLNASTSLKKCDANGDANHAQTLKEIYQEISLMNLQIQAELTKVKENPVLNEFAQTAKNAGAMGAMGLIPKVPQILPELAPVLSAIKTLVEVGQKQHELTGKIIQKLEG